MPNTRHVSPLRFPFCFRPEAGQVRRARGTTGACNRRVGVRALEGSKHAPVLAAPLKLRWRTRWARPGIKAQQAVMPEFDAQRNTEGDPSRKLEQRHRRGRQSGGFCRQ